MWRRHSSILIQRIQGLDRRGRIIATGIVAFLFWLLLMAGWWVWGAMQTQHQTDEVLATTAERAAQAERAAAQSAAWNALLERCTAELRLLEDHWRGVRVAPGDVGAAAASVMKATHEVRTEFPGTAAAHTLHLLSSALATDAETNWAALQRAAPEPDDPFGSLPAALGAALRHQRSTPLPDVEISPNGMKLSGVTETAQLARWRSESLEYLQRARMAPAWDHNRDRVAPVVLLLEAMQACASEQWDEAAGMVAEAVDDPLLGGAALLLKSRAEFAAGRFREAARSAEGLAARGWPSASQVACLAWIGAAVEAGAGGEDRGPLLDRARASLERLGTTHPQDDALPMLRQALEAASKR